MSYQWMAIYDSAFEPPKRDSRDVAAPVGYQESEKAGSQKPGKVPVKAKHSTAQLDELRLKKHWEFCYGPLKSVPMNLVMSYFTPNSLQLIPIMMTLNLLLNPIRDIFNNVGKIEDFENVVWQDAVLMKLCYIGSCLVNVGVGIWKLNKMGLIPNTKSDWLSWELAQTALERT